MTERSTIPSRPLCFTASDNWENLLGICSSGKVFPELDAYAAKGLACPGASDSGHNRSMFTSTSNLIQHHLWSSGMHVNHCPRSYNDRPNQIIIACFSSNPLHGLVYQECTPHYTIVYKSEENWILIVTRLSERRDPRCIHPPGQWFPTSIALSRCPTYRPFSSGSVTKEKRHGI